MTSSHRSTYHFAKGKSEQGGYRTIPSTMISVKNMPGYLNVKRRNDLDMLNKIIKVEEEDDDDEEEEDKFENKNYIQENENENEEGEEEEEEEEDEEEELKKELEKIKKEKEDEKERKKQKESKEIMKEIERINENISSNSKYNETLLNITNRQNDYSLKKKWYEEGIFKNQYREKEKKKGIKNELNNDTLRKDYHKDFINKTIQ